MENIYYMLNCIIIAERHHNKKKKYYIRKDEKFKSAKKINVQEYSITNGLMEFVSRKRIT